MGANNADFFAGRGFAGHEGGTTYLHGTNVKLNIGDVVKPNGDSLLQSGRHGGIYGVEPFADDPRARQPRAWVVPAQTGEISSGNARHALEYALRAEYSRPTKEKRAYLYQVEPLSEVEKFRSPENEVSNTGGFRITKILADVPQDHYASGNWSEDKGMYLTHHQQGYGRCESCGTA